MKTINSGVDILSFTNSKEIYEKLVESVVDYAIFVLNKEGIVVTWNSGAKNLKGYNAQEIIGQHFSKFYSEYDINTGKPQMELKIAEELGRYEDEGWRIKKDSTKFWANVIISAMKDSDGKLIGFSKVTRDLTERKTAEEQLKLLNESLEQKVLERTSNLKNLADQLELALKSRDEFITVASHELNTPLTTLKLQVQVRCKQLFNKGLSVFSSEKLVRLFNDDLRQINRISRLVTEMIDMTKITSGKFVIYTEIVNLGDIINKAITNIQKQKIENHLSITFLSDERVLASVDPYRFEQVVTNLILNAIKYGKKKPIKIELHKTIQEAVIMVEDYGIGVDPSDHDRIFNQYERAISSNEVSGLGLGLFFVKKIIEAHKGSIKINSGLGRGSKFYVTFPLN